MRLEEGAGRFDVNVSIRFQENGKRMWPPQSEIKNLNSYQALRDAVAFESNRLWEEWRSGGDIRTRTGKITVGWSPERGRTYLQRSKEDVEDYRYFPEPDLVSLAPSPETVAKLRETLPALTFRQGGEERLVDHHTRGPVERSRQVLALGNVDGRLAADRSVDLPDERRRHCDPRHAARGSMTLTEPPGRRRGWIPWRQSFWFFGSSCWRPSGTCQ